MEKETREYLKANGLSEDYLEVEVIKRNREYIENETKQVPQIVVASLSIGFDAMHTLLPYNKDGLSMYCAKKMAYLNYDSPYREKALENVLVFLKSRFPKRRYFNVCHEKYSKDEFIVTKNLHTARIEFESAFSEDVYIIKPNIFVLPNGDAVLEIKKKGGEYIGFFVIDEVSRLLPDIETIANDDTLFYPALSEHRKQILKGHPEIKFSPDVLEYEGLTQTASV